MSRDEVERQLEALAKSLDLRVESLADIAASRWPGERIARVRKLYVKLATAHEHDRLNVCETKALAAGPQTRARRAWETKADRAAKNLDYWEKNAIAVWDAALRGEADHG